MSIVSNEGILTGFSVRITKKLKDKQKKGEIPHIARIGDILPLTGLVTKEHVNNALKTQKTERKMIGELLVDCGFVTEDQVAAALAVKFGLEFVDLSKEKPSREAVSLVSPVIARKLKVMPIGIENNVLRIAISSPIEHANIEDTLRFALHRKITIVVASAYQITQAIDRYYRNGFSFFGNSQEKMNGREKQKDKKAFALSSVDIDHMIDQMVNDDDIVVVEEEEEDILSESDSLVIKLVNNILVSAASRGASDIHFETSCEENQTFIRFRIDGICHDVYSISSVYERALISRIKIMSSLDIAERRRPQSGKIKLKYLGETIEYRVEITPTTENREDAVLRILSHTSVLPLDQLGFSDSNLIKFKNIIEKPYGMILCVGPTSSGKTTTLHAALGHINTPDKKIWTAEDPIEITQPRLRQVQVNAAIGFTFQSALRSFLRADPDVIMIGEMRDLETARTAIEASLTGHLVFSTLHTNSASETIGRLIEMGIEPYNFADALIGVLAQRLCRRLCEKCKKEEIMKIEEFDTLLQLYGAELYKEDNLPMNYKELKMAKPGRCSSCSNSGYSGRVATHELLINSDAIKKAIRQNKANSVIKELAIADGMRTLRADGIQKALKGITTVNEVIRVTG